MLLLKVFFEDNEIQIIAERAAESLIVVREGARFGSEGIASPLIPGDKSVAHVNDSHLDATGSVFAGEVFGCSEEGSTEMIFLKAGMDSEEAEVPGVVRFRIEENGAEDWPAGVFAMDEEVGFRFGGELFAEETFGEPRAFDENYFGVPACLWASAAEGEVDEIDDCRIVGFNSRSEQHGGQSIAPL